MFWIVIAIMLAAAVIVVAWPLYRSQGRFTLTSGLSIVLISAVAALVYAQIGSPGTPSGRSEAPDIDAMVSSLASRLEENPDDLNGWKMLGRSYLQVRNFNGAVSAFEKAVALESNRDGATLADLGEAVLFSDETSLNGRAGRLFENAVALVPDNPKALFYSGMAAIERGDNELGADRWEALLATSPPPNVQDILRQRIAELRGENAPAPSSDNGASGPAQAQGPVVEVDISLSDAAAAAVSDDMIVFVIARDPAQPSPPIAAVRRQVSELPAVVSIGDSDAMIPGRVPSAFSPLEIVVRVSLSGQPIASTGDWFGDAIVNTQDAREVQISIDQQVP